MGERMGPRTRDWPEDGAERQLRRERFGRYFPRLFAYASTLIGHDGAAAEVVIESFTRVFARYPHLADADFAVVLFGFARDLCRAVSARRQSDDGLSFRERDVISLVFDAQLSRTEIASILGAKDQAVGHVLLKGLRKLRESASARAAASAS